MRDRSGARLAQQGLPVAQRQSLAVKCHLQPAVDGDGCAERDFDRGVATELLRELAGHHTADIATIAREPRAIEARRDDDRIVHSNPPRRGTRRAHAGIASLPVRETACLLCDASPRVKTMSRFVPWALVALCFALGVASRSISDSFVVFVPALQSAFDASRSAITVVYSFALLVGGTGAPLAGWIVDRFGLRALTVIGMSAAALATASASQATEVWHLYLGLAVAWSASGVGAMVMLPLAQHLIVRDGWRHAYIVFAVISAAFIPLLLVLP